MRNNGNASKAERILRDAILNGTARCEKYRYNPIVYPDQAWEFQFPNVAYLWGSVCHDPEDGIFRMWYSVVDYILKDTLLCYAESDNGIHWRKPNLNLVAYRDSSANNILLRGNFFDLDGTVVYLDTTESNPCRRFKRLTNISPPHTEAWEDATSDPVQRRRIYENCYVELAYSSDGIHWPDNGKPVIEGSYIDSCLSFLRRPDGCGFEMFARPELANRVMARWESEDLTSWSHGDIILRAPDWPNKQLYTMSVIRLAGTYFGFASVYNMPVSAGGNRQSLVENKELSPDGGRYDTLEVYLATSTDGNEWRWLDPDKPFLALGRPGSFDSGRLYVHHQPIVVGDQLYIYYTALDCLHYARHHGDPVHGAIGLCVLSP